MEKQYSLKSALFWYTFGTFLIKAVSFLTLRLFTDLLSTIDYGIYGVFQSYLGIFEILILLGTSHTIKMVKYNPDIDYNKYVSSVSFIPVLGTILLLCLARILFFFTDIYFYKKYVYLI